MKKHLLFGFEVQKPLQMGVSFLTKATPIYLLVLHAQEVENEPFWNKKKVEKCDFFYFF